MPLSLSSSDSFGLNFDGAGINNDGNGAGVNNDGNGDGDGDGGDEFSSSAIAEEGCPKISQRDSFLVCFVRYWNVMPLKVVFRLDRDSEVPVGCPKISQPDPFFVCVRY